MRFPSDSTGRKGRVGSEQFVGAALALGLAALALGPSIHCRAQENPLDNVQTPAPPPPSKSPGSDSNSNPNAQKPTIDRGATGTVEGALHGDARMHVDVNLVRVPATVTDPLNRLVTGLEKENFALSDNNIPQTIRYFSSEDAPITIGVVFDLSGSMASKFVRARKALTAFLRTSNPQDEFFVVGFNDKPSIIVDYTSDPDDVEARMVMLKPENRTALIDAVYLGIDHLRLAKYDRKALLIISDGGDNRSRYTESELERVVRESGVQVYAIGIFDNYAPSTEEQMGPELLKEICEMTGAIRDPSAGHNVSLDPSAPRDGPRSHHPRSAGRVQRVPKDLRLVRGIRRRVGIGRRACRAADAPLFARPHALRANRVAASGGLRDDRGIRPGAIGRGVDVLVRSAMPVGRRSLPGRQSQRSAKSLRGDSRPVSASRRLGPRWLPRGARATIAAPQPFVAAAARSDPLLAVSDVHKVFQGRGQRSVNALRGVSIEIGPNESVGLVGESGIGQVHARAVHRRLGDPDERPDRSRWQRHDGSRSPESV